MFFLSFKNGISRAAWRRARGRVGDFGTVGVALVTHALHEVFGHAAEEGGDSLGQKRETLRPETTNGIHSSKFSSQSCHRVVFDECLFDVGRISSFARNECLRTLISRDQISEPEEAREPSRYLGQKTTPRLSILVSIDAVSIACARPDPRPPAGRQDLDTCVVLVFVTPR